MTRRRMPGEGTIYQRASDKRWVAALSVGSRADRVIHRRYARTKAGAKAELDHLKTELAAPQSSMTLGVYLRSWLDQSAAPSIRPNTLRGYDAIIRTHLSGIAHVPLRDLTPELIEAQLATIERAPKTVRNAQIMLRRALGQAEARGHVARNVARLVPLRHVPRRLQEPLTGPEAKAIRAAMGGDRFAAAVDLAMVGLRQGEILGLAWSDVDLERRVATIRYELVRRDGRYLRDDVKSEASAAPVPLPPFVVAALKRHETAQKAERIAAGRPTERGLVFVTERGRPVNGAWFTRHFQQRLAAAGIPRMVLHSLRHGAASILIAAGVHPRVAQAYLRHANARTTMEVYAHVSAAQQVEAAAVLERVIGDG